MYGFVVTMSLQHNRATERFAVGTTHSAHVSWPNIRSVPLAFYHFSVHPCADLYYYTTVDVPATRDLMSRYPNVVLRDILMRLVLLYLLAG